MQAVRAAHFRSLGSRLFLVGLAAAIVGPLVLLGKLPAWADSVALSAEADASVPSSGPVASRTWGNVDVTHAPAGNSRVSFALATANRRALAMVSREGANVPQLVVELPKDATALDSPVPPAPTGTQIPGPTATATPTSTPTSIPTNSPPSPADTIRAAFYYPWFPEAWSQHRIYPFTNYHPSLGYYDLKQSSTIRQHIAAMQYGKISVGISSWWGQGHSTDLRLPLLLTSAGGTGFGWTIYHEGEGQGDPSVAQLTSDLTYIRDRYASDPSFLNLDGKVCRLCVRGCRRCLWHGRSLEAGKHGGCLSCAQGVLRLPDLRFSARRLASVRAGPWPTISRTPTRQVLALGSG